MSLLEQQHDPWLLVTIMTLLIGLVVLFDEEMIGCPMEPPNINWNTMLCFLAKNQLKKKTLLDCNKKKKKEMHSMQMGLGLSLQLCCPRLHRPQPNLQ